MGKTKKHERSITNKLNSARRRQAHRSNRELEEREAEEEIERGLMLWNEQIVSGPLGTFDNSSRD